MKKISVFITHSLGEIDAILPIACCLNYKKKEFKFNLYFSSSKIYKQFINNKFYTDISKNLDIKYTSFQLLNKWDFNILLKNKYLSLIYYFILKIFFYAKVLFFSYRFINSDIFMHETSNQKYTTNILEFFSKYFNKKIYVYHHGLSINYGTKNINRINYSSKKLFLLYHPIGKNWAESYGYKKQFNLGMPNTFKEWHKILADYNTKFKDKYNEKFVLIYSRGINPLYMDEDKYIKLITSSYKTIRKIMKNTKIIIKPHPREDILLLNSIIKKNNFTNIEISKDYSGILALNSLCVISFWTSAILLSLSLNIPSIEYYIESKNFRTKENDLGSPYKEPFCIGTQSTDKENELEIFLLKVTKNEPFDFQKIKSNFKTRNLDCFYN